MVDSISYRTSDLTRWGTGNGSDLSAAQIDINFWVLHSLIVSLQDSQDAQAGIAYFTLTGTQLTVHLTNHVALGPYTLPMAQWNFRDAWQAFTAYNINDVFTEGGAV